MSYDLISLAVWLSLNTFRTLVSEQNLLFSLLSWELCSPHVQYGNTANPGTVLPPSAEHVTFDSVKYL